MSMLPQVERCSSHIVQLTQDTASQQTVIYTQKMHNFRYAVNSNPLVIALHFPYFATVPVG
jgi:hypothetical protein